MSSRPQPPSSGYYAPMRVERTVYLGAWTLAIGTTPDGAWCLHARSTAAARYQRFYFDTREQAEAELDRYVTQFETALARRQS
jgi:hypothetical protein